VEPECSALYVPPISGKDDKHVFESGTTYPLSTIGCSVNHFDDTYAMLVWGGNVRKAQLEGRPRINATHAFTSGEPQGEMRVNPI
jgi:hypothetical protein